LKLIDLIDRQLLHELMDSFYRLTGLSIGVFDTEGRIISHAGCSDICTEFHRKHPVAGSHYAKAPREALSSEPSNRLFYCPNNMPHFSSRIVVGERPVGILMTGGFFEAERPPDKAFFLENAARYGFREDDYLAALERVPIVQKAPLKAAWDLADAVARMLSSIAFSAVALMEKISEKERLKDGLMQARRLESLGRLAGGAAHHLNNLLGVILGGADMALMSQDLDEQVRGHLKMIVKAAKRCGELTRRLLAFASRQTALPRTIDINKVIEGMLPAIGPLLGKGVAVQWMPGPDLPPVRIDPRQLEEVILELCTNARDAMDGSGTLTIETLKAGLKDDAGVRSGEGSSQYVLLKVADTGCGIDEKDIPRLFEPSFSTKPVGQGIGLGLAMVHGIVRQYGGFIEVESTAGRGAMFTIHLPAHHEKKDDRHDQESNLAARKRTILLVEDEPLMLEMGKMMLERLGYRVMAASGADRAIEITLSQGPDLDLVITDTALPEMSGKELARKITSILPRIKILYTSPQEYVIMGMLQKPFSLAEMAEKVKAALG
jgi:signal transduction histidine kinase